MPLTKNTEPHPRYSNLAEAGKKPITDAEAQALVNAVDFSNDLGIDSDLGRFSTTVNSKRFTPRVFFTAKKPDGSDHALSFNESKFDTWWGKDFWNQVQLGNVFVFPARQTKPCQLQLTRDENGKLKLSLSQPIEPGNLPKRNVKAPSGWQKFWNIFGFYKDAVNSYKNRELSAKQIADTVTAFSKDRENTDLKNETDPEIKKAERAKQAEKDMLVLKMVARINKEQTVARDTAKFLKTIYGPDTAKVSLSSFGPGNAGEYSQDSLNKMLYSQKEDLYFNHRLVQANNEEVTALTFFSSKEPLKTAEIMAKENHGGKEGLDAIKNTVAPLRTEMKDDIRKYESDGKAKAVFDKTVDAINNVSTIFKGQSFPGGKFTPAQKAVMDMSKDVKSYISKVVKDEDIIMPGLNEKVGVKKIGDTVKVINGYTAFRELDKARVTAKSNLIRSENGETTLDYYGKNMCLRNIIKAEIAERIMADELSRGETSFTMNLPDNMKQLDKVTDVVMQKGRL